MTYLHSLILGAVEGLTEFLPISSTAHLVITSKILGLADGEFLKSFEISIQLGAIIAVAIWSWKLIFKGRDLWLKVLTAFIPTGIIGFLLYSLIKKYALSNIVLVAWALIIGGIGIIIFEKIFAQKLKSSGGEQSLGDISYKKAFLIGLAQSLAVIPGVSRSAATIIAGLSMKISRSAIIEFSFLLALPTIAMATAYDVYKNASTFSTDQFGLLLVGLVTAFIFASLSIKWLLKFIKSHSFSGFGIYRIIIGTLVLIFLA